MRASGRTSVLSSSMTLSGPLGDFFGGASVARSSMTASGPLSDFFGGASEEDPDFDPRPSSRVSRISQQLDGKKVLMLTSGTRGDVQPFAALASHLQASGFNVLIVTNKNHTSFLEKFGLQVLGELLDFEEQLQHPLYKEFMATGDFRIAEKAMKEMRAAELQNFSHALDVQCQAVRDFRPELIIATALELINGLVLSRLFELPSVNCVLQPMKPTKYLKSMMGEPFFSWTAWQLLHKAMFKMMRENRCSIIVEKFGAELGGDTIYPTFDSYMCEVMCPIAPELVGVSPALVQRPKDWPKSLDPLQFVGFWVVSQTEQRRRLEKRDSKFGGGSLAALERFLEGGKPPVYMGWGSMTPGDPKRMLCLAVRALKQAGVRGIILSGWAKLSASMVKGEPDERELEAYMQNVLLVDTAPHEWLFPQCAATVHHGGAGTTAAALRSGVPTVITPCFLDQFAYAELTEKSGCGVRMPQISKVTPQKLSAAILRCCSDAKMIERSRQMGALLREEDGMTRATEALERFLTEDVASGAWRQRFEARRAEDQAAAARAAARGPGCCRRRQAPLPGRAPSIRSSTSSGAQSDEAETGLPRVLGTGSQGLGEPKEPKRIAQV